MKTFDLAALLENGSAAEKYWASMFLVAVGDQATRLSYDPTRDSICMMMEVAGVEYKVIAPPKEVAPKLVKAILRLVRSRSLRSIVREYLSDSPTMVEGQFSVRIGRHEVHVDASVSPKVHRVVLRFTPNALAAVEAGPLLDRTQEISAAGFGELLDEAYGI